MHEWQSLSHVRWECKYHVVIIPKYRRKVFYGRLRHQIGPILRELVPSARSRADGRSCDARPCPPVPEHPSQVQRGAYDRIPEMARVLFASIGSYFKSVG